MANVLWYVGDTDSDHFQANIQMLTYIWLKAESF